MATTKVFKSGNSQAVRLPKGYQFDVEEVEILRRGNEVVLRKPAADLSQAFALLTSLPGDAFAGKREDLPPQKRKAL